MVYTGGLKLKVSNASQRTEEKDDLSHILKKLVSLVNNSKCCQQNLILQEAFETTAKKKEQLKETEFDGAFCKQLKFLIDSFFSFTSV